MNWAVPRSLGGTCAPSSRNDITVGVEGVVPPDTHVLKVRVVLGVTMVITPLFDVHVPVSLKDELPEILQLQPPPLATHVLLTGKSA